MPRVGIWLMPDNQSLGELEDFVAQMIPDNDPVWPLSQDYISRIPEEHREFAENKTSTAEVYAWLATREDPRQMGAAIGARDLEHRWSPLHELHRLAGQTFRVGD